MKELSEEDIAQQLKFLIEKNVNQIESNDNKYKHHYENVMSELENEIKITESTIEDFTESRLSINLIEQEGYLRCLRTMVNMFRDWEKYL